MMRASGSPGVWRIRRVSSPRTRYHRLGIRGSSMRCTGWRLSTSPPPPGVSTRTYPERPTARLRPHQSMLQFTSPPSDDGWMRRAPAWRAPSSGDIQAIFGGLGRVDETAMRGLFGATAGRMVSSPRAGTIMEAWVPRISVEPWGPGWREPGIRRGSVRRFTLPVLRFSS